MTDLPRIVIVIPLERTVPAEVFHSFLRIAMVAAQRGHAFLSRPDDTRPFDQADVALNNDIRAFLASPGTHLCILGMDHQHPQDAVARLEQRVIEDPTRQIVGGVHYRSGIPYNPILYMRDPDTKHYNITDWDEGSVFGAVEEITIGMGSTLIAREVFEAMQPPWFVSELIQGEDGWWSTRLDTAFLKRAKAAGFKTYCDTAVTSRHMIVDWADREKFEAYRAAHQEKVEAAKEN
jgi:hypothetical protein